MEQEPKPKSPVAFLHNMAARVRSWWSSNVTPWAKENPKSAAIVVALAAIGSILWMGGSVLVNGLVAGCLVAGAAGIIVYKCQHSENQYLRMAYNTAISYPLVTDVILSVIALLVAPAGITGWVAASITALLASVWLLGAEPVALEDHNPELENTLLGLDPAEA